MHFEWVEVFGNVLVEIEQSALIEHAITQIRDKNTNPSDFRKNLRRIGRYLIYEAGKSFEMIDDTIETPLESAEIRKSKHEVVIISVLRAALPMVDSIFEEFDNASLGVVSASRGEQLDERGKEFKIQADYIKIPNLSNKIAILVDPMLATASTLLYLLDIVSKENPSKIIVISAIGSEYGVKQIESSYPNVEIYCGTVDKILNDKGYIVPGLGDAGDRACNTGHL